MLFSISPLDTTETDAEEGRKFNVVALGTSLTEIGGWATHLEAALEHCLGRSVHVVRIASNGATSDWGLRQIGRVVSEIPDVVLIEFSINDAAIDRFMGTSRSRANLTGMVDQLQRQLPAARILIMAMNPVRGLRAAIRPMLASYIEAHHEVAREQRVEFIDFRPIWLRLPEAKLAAAIPDGIHPIAEAAVEVMVPELVKTIAVRACYPHNDPGYGEPSITDQMSE